MLCWQQAIPLAWMVRRLTMFQNGQAWSMSMVCLSALVWLLPRINTGCDEAAWLSPPLIIIVKQPIAGEVGACGFKTGPRTQGPEEAGPHVEHCCSKMCETFLSYQQSKLEMWNHKPWWGSWSATVVSWVANQTSTACSNTWILLGLQTWAMLGVTSALERHTAWTRKDG